MRNHNFKLVWDSKAEKATVNGLQMIPDTKVSGTDGYEFSLRFGGKGVAWHVVGFKGDQFIPPHIPLTADGEWSLTIVKDQRPPSARNPSGLWLSRYNKALEKDPIKRLLRDVGIKGRPIPIADRQYVKVSGDQPIDVEVSGISDLKSMPQGLRAVSFITDGVRGGGDHTTIHNMGTVDTHRDQIVGATFCIHYSTEMRNGKLESYINKIHIREDSRALRPKAFEQALAELSNIDSKRPRMFITNGSADPEPGVRTQMSEALAGLQV